MLRDALSHDRELLLPFLVLGFFCGLRPDGELLKVRWSDICLEGTPQLTVRAEIAKTAQRRFIDLQPNAIEWLKLCEGEREGQILSVASHVIRDKRTKQHSRLGIQFPKNGMRHTFCSCWLAKFEDVNKLLIHTGHKHLVCSSTTTTREPRRQRQRLSGQSCLKVTIASFVAAQQLQGCSRRSPPMTYAGNGSQA